jgi:ribose transport system ATP-binding protein
MVGCATAVGLLNGVMVRGLRMSPVIATLVTFIVLEGLSLLLRPQPGGSINLDVVTAIGTTIGFVPVAFLTVIGLGLALELALRRSRWGLELRSVGSREEVAHALGARVTRTHIAAYVACALLTFLGAVMLMAQVGIGDATAGSSYTLSSITAVVLGGASVFGGRGSFLGVLSGAALIQTVLNATTFLSLDSAWQYWLLGGLTLAAVASYSMLRDPALRSRLRTA